MKNKLYLFVAIFLGILLFSSLKINAQNCWNPINNNYKMGFEENEIDFSNWYIDNWWENIGTNWQRWNYPEFSHSGRYFIGITEYNKYCLYSRCFDLKKDTLYQMSFWYMTDSLISNQNLSITLGYSQDPATMTTILQNKNNILNKNWEKTDIFFTVPKDSSYYFGWYAYGYTKAYVTGIFMDDISIRKFVCDSINPNITYTKEGICHNSGDSIQLDAGAGYSSYNWNNGVSNNRYLWVKTAGEYIIQATNSLGCFGRDTARILDYNLPNIKISTATNNKNIVGNDSLMLIIKNLSGTGMNSIEWNNESSNTNEFYAKTAGLYSVLAVDTNGCKGSDFVSILKTEKGGICFNSGDSILADAGNNYTSYNWSNGLPNNRLVYIKTSGTYTVTLTGSNNYNSINVINISDFQLPDIKIRTVSSKNYICGGNSLGLFVDNLSGSGFGTYNWNNGYSNNSIINADTAGAYSVILTDTNSCIGKDTIHLTVPLAPILSLTTAGARTICYTDSVTFKGHVLNGADSSYIFTWMPYDVEGDTLFKTYYGGNYYFTATNKETGCTYESDSVTITQHPLPYQEICIVSVDSASGKNMVVWHKNHGEGIKAYNIYKENTSSYFTLRGIVAFDSTSVFIDNNSNPKAVTARYKITAVDSCDNESEMSPYHETIHLNINKGINGEHNLIWNSYVGFHFNTFFIYQDTSENMSNMQPIAFVQSTLNSYTVINPNPNTINYYMIKVSPTEGVCTFDKKAGTITSSYSNIASSKTIGVEELTEDNLKLRIYPNPVSLSTVISWQLTVKSKVNIRVYNITGREIKTVLDNEQLPGSNKIDLDMMVYENGIYFVKVKIGEKEIMRKITKL